MRVTARRPVRLGEISEWLRRGEISSKQALRLALDLRQQQEALRPAAAPLPEPAVREERVRAVMAELDGLIGLQGVKQLVREVQAFAAIGMRRAAAGLVSQATGLHMVFTGNPGTGKTTVARLLSRLFREMGLLRQGQMVEAERADLVGEYIGHTAQKTRETIGRAIGGVLFVDEAYSLARGGEKDFGKESIDCLVRAMEEHRGELLIILAGYPVEMDWFLNQNPGLRSRFPVQIAFEDYGPAELQAIALSMWRERQYELSPDAQTALGWLLEDEGWPAGGECGNARAIRNLVERSLRCQALRLVGRAQLSREELITITRADLEEACRSQKKALH